MKTHVRTSEVISSRFERWRAELRGAVDLACLLRCLTAGLRVCLFLLVSPHGTADASLSAVVSHVMEPTFHERGGEERE